ncbi:pentaheme c-type cytochrome TorC [Consotaella salsifontis]|uniref:Cytochrome c-type protein n=1 Tax=Consotaella salsifontis TaxID=1365950 RepID=A0A1T4NY43_9HYPH|nr:pentaheme c-type cytochrome TorC [Consotaella salsifontis]SJZ84139.1 trimethylamine-N-oxide reductase (cytochrome c), cytochrome c-type subunit TorC [Consotaella salsifontis]
MIKRAWKAFWRPSMKWGLGVLLIGGIFVGVLGWNGLHYAMEKTSGLEFCVSCHSMRDNVYPEYVQSIHFKNPAGVQAECADCHERKTGLAAYVDKFNAWRDIWGEIRGTIDTPEKFEQNRLRLAKQVWKHMEETDSATCRSCHDFAHMDFDKQKPEAAKQMQTAMQNGDTCISCHKGIAHKLPDMAAGYKALFNDLVAASSDFSPKTGDVVYPLETTEFFLEEPKDGKGKAAGKVLSATPLKVVDKDGDWLKVEAEGWQQEGAERMLYANQGKRIFAVALTPAAANEVKKGETKPDADTGQNWTDVIATGWVKNEKMTADADKLWDYGSEMYSASCGSCHALPDTKHYLANQWIGTLNAMKRFAPLDDEQFRFLQKYVQLHAKDMEGGHE